MTRIRRPLVYAAHPMTTYGTDLERHALRRIAALLPGARVIDPSVHYVSARHWLEDWPVLVQALDVVVVFGDETGAIGAGCLREVADALCANVAVVVVDKEGQLRELRSLRLLPPTRRTPARTAIPVAGSLVEPVLIAGLRRAARKGGSNG